MKICSKQADLVTKSNFPKFKYRFAKADVPVEVDDKHAEKVLVNPTFYEYKGKKLNKSKGDN